MTAPAQGAPVQRQRRAVARARKWKATITNEVQCQSAIGMIRSEFKRTGYLRVSITDDKPRSLPQNALSHTFYEQIARELGEDSPDGVKAECKLRYGVPILRRDDEQFRAMYDASLKGLPYELKLQVMNYLPVTSLMSTTQLSEYLETIAKEYAKRSVVLEFPSDYAR